MTLGQRVRKARIESGFSQRVLCGDVITRNMLSMIENDAASPSIATLKYLADKMNKPVSYFLDETPTQLPADLATLQEAQEEFDHNRFQTALNLLLNNKEVSPALFEAIRILRYRCLIRLAEEAVQKQKLPYARTLLAEAEKTEPDIPWIATQRKILQGDIEPMQESFYPNMDSILLLSAKAALMAGDPLRAGALLDAARNSDTAEWNLLRGKAFAEQKKYTEAIPFLLRSEQEGEKATYPLLEICFRETGDFEKAYRYACCQRR